MSPRWEKKGVMSTYDPVSYWNSRVSGNLDLATVGQIRMGAYNELAYRLRLNALYKAIKKIDLPLSKTCLFETGFGTGFYLHVWKQFGVKEVVGVDLSEQALRRAKDLFPNFHLFQHNIVDPLPATQNFDLVTAIDVLYHIVDDDEWQQAIENICKPLKKGGFLIFTDKFPPQGTYQTAPHVRRRSLDMYRNCLANQGLRIIHIFPVFVFMDDPLKCGVPRWLSVVSLIQWRLLSKSIHIFEFYPKLQRWLALTIAAIQYPFERFALAVSGRSPNLEIVIAQKQNA